MGTENDGSPGRASPEISPIHRTSGPTPKGPGEAPAPPRPRMSQEDTRVAMRYEHVSSAPERSAKSSSFLWVVIALGVALALWWFLR